MESEEVAVFAQMSEAITAYIGLFSDDHDEVAAAYRVAIDAVIEASDHVGQSD